MSTPAALERICCQARQLSDELNSERLRRLRAEAEIEKLHHRLRCVEIALHGTTPLSALDLFATEPPNSLH